MTLTEKALTLTLDDLTTPRPIAEYHEDFGDVLWWKFPIDEPPYVGSPNDLGQEVLILTAAHAVGGELAPYRGGQEQRVNVGGWPGYHTHWSPLPIVRKP